MSSDLRKAAEVALEALEWSWGGEPISTKEIEAMILLRSALSKEEAVDWEAVSADQAMTIAMLQVEISELKEKINVQRFP